LSIFKKKRFSEVEGYERISKLIEERQREMSGDEVDPDDLGEDTVLLAPASRPGQREQPIEPPTQRRLPDPYAASAEPVARTEPPQAFAPAMPAGPLIPPQPAVATTPQPPRMQAPEFPTVAGKAVSLVSKDAVWDGKLACTGDVRVEGRLEGEVETAGTLYVAAEARVHGTVRARSVMLAGEIEGQLRCEERLEILPGGSARGEIDTGSLVVHEGAFIESKFQMRREGTPARG
jgi:cytoskeletal protein CcmA (bactofilin family)